ncbi:PKD domain-containing protein [Kaarinaea lacus]
MEIVSSNRRTVVILAFFGIWLLIPGQAIAVPSGISGYSGASGSTCTACHPAGAAVPTVTLSADSGSTTVDPGSTTSYTLTMTGGPASNAGLDVAASAGTIIDTNANGTRILNGELTMSSPNPVSNGTISWTFDWQAPLAAGTYTIYAAALSGNGTGGTGGDGTGTTSLQITVAAPTNQPPTAMISGPTTGIEGGAVTFDGSGSSDSDGSIVSYDWDLGDGSSATGVSVTHTYGGGTYTVVLTVTDDSGNTDSASLTIEVAVPNVPPVAEISGPTNGTEGVAVSFDGSGSSDPDGSVVAYDWDFGDNSAGAGATVTHTYTAGTYTVTLTVTDDMGATGDTTLTIDIAASTEPQAPIADAGGPYEAEVGAAVQFDGSASTDPDGSIASYSWDFGDGTTDGTGVGPVHVYTASGNYTVVLMVTDDQGMSGTGQTTALITEIVVPPPDPTPPPDPQLPEPQPQTGEELYNTYCVACHGAGGTGGPDGDVVRESADDIADAIEDESEMRFLSDVLSGSDIEAIATFLDTDGHRGDDEEKDEEEDEGRKDDRRCGDGNRRDGNNRRDCDRRGDDRKGDENDEGSSSQRANPFATEEDAQAQNASDGGGGSLHWLVILSSMFWLAIRKKNNS